MNPPTWFRETALTRAIVVTKQNGQVRINRWSGKLTTVIGSDHQPATSFKGTWSSVSGPAGHGTYQGRITGADTYTVEWAGDLDVR